MMEQKHGEKKKRRPSLRKSGTIALKKMDRDLSKKKRDSKHHSASDLMEEKMAIALKKAKKSGLASSKTVAGMAAFSKSSFVDDMENVHHASNDTKRSFRLRMFGLFILQLTLLNIIVFITVRPDLLGAPGLRLTLATHLGSNNNRLTTMMCLFIGLIIIYWVKYRKMVASALLFIWTVGCGIGMGVMSYYAQSYGIIQILLYTYFTVILTAFLSQFESNKLFCKKRLSGDRANASVVPELETQEQKPGSDSKGQVMQQDARNEEPELTTCLSAGLLAYAIVFIVALIIQITANYPADSPYFRSGYHFISCTLLSLILVAWTMYDADLMHYKLSEDEWSHTIVFFWADMLMLFSLCCLICLCCLMGGSDGGFDGGDGGGDISGDADFGAADNVAGDGVQIV